MPFVTEELWDKLYGAPGGLLMLRNWPADGARAEDAAAAAEIDWLIRLIDGVRAARAALNVPAGAKIAMIVNGDPKSTRLNSLTNAHLVCRLLLEKKTQTPAREQ